MDRNHWSVSSTEKNILLLMLVKQVDLINDDIILWKTANFTKEK